MAVNGLSGDIQWTWTENMKAISIAPAIKQWQVINAILYIVVGGIQWRMLPKEYPKWQSVYNYFRIWRDDGTWQRIHDTLRAQVREK